MILKKYILFVLLAALASQNVYAQNVEQVLQTLPNQEAFWSVTVLDEGGEKLESYHSDKLIIPASNQKLYTLSAALDRLGSDFRYTTNIYGKGELVGSTWKGDLIIKGSGDPSISGFLYDDDRYFVFKSFLKQLKERGVKQYSGSISKNLDYFDDQVYPIGWDWHDLTFYYGVEIAPLSFNNNAVDIEVIAEGDIGDKPIVSYFPNHYPIKLLNSIFEEQKAITINNQQIIVDKNEKYDEKYLRALGTNQIFLGSKLPKGYKEVESLSISNAGNFFIETFEIFLKQNGVKNLDNSLLDVQYSSVLDSFPILASHTSKPLSELVKWANKESDNFYTEMILKTLAAEEQGIPGTFENGIKEVRSFLAEQGLDTTLVKMNDGSGLAMGNYTTTGNISRLLYAMKSHKESEVFYNSLPIAGIDGSIAHRFKGTKLYNNVRAKTGFVSGVRTLSGYMTASSGRKITFSLATNHFVGKVSPVDNSHQQILEYLYAKY